MYNCVIVGAGLSGAVIARKLAEEKNQKVQIIERRNHIAGNLFDEKSDFDILVQKYGPHIFHTNNEEVYSFITKYGEWNDYRLNCEVVMDGMSTPSPFNYKTIDMFYDKDIAKRIKENIEKEYPGRNKATIVEMLESKNPIVKEYADMLFEKDYSLYTAKQWGISPKEIDVSVLKRVPVRFDYIEKYFDDKYECVPMGGYTTFIQSLLNHENITVMIGEDALNSIKVDEANEKILIEGNDSSIPVVFTGPIDELFEFKYGKLPYRSLKFEYKTLNMPSFQNAPVVAYPQVDDYTRVTEYTKLPYQDGKENTIVAFEYPLQFEGDSATKCEPYYPIINDINIDNYNEYIEKARKINNLFLCGRLADYKYYNMDNAIERAFKVYDNIVDYMGL